MQEDHLQRWRRSREFPILDLVQATMAPENIPMRAQTLTAARLSGVSVLGVLILVYTLSGALAGLGGVVMASQLKSGAPTYGHMYELYVIAAVVVGGTSLAGGEGKITGTLIGALILAVIQNGMNLLGFDSNTQKCILGGVLLLAILLDGSRYKLTR